MGGQFKHGMCKTRTYRVWANMLTRCENSNADAWDNYGGKGVYVCKRWHTFTGFFADMGECPKDLTLERIESDKPYCKENCKWATRTEQNNNRYNVIDINVKIMIRNMPKLFPEYTQKALIEIVSREFGLNPHGVKYVMARR